MVEEKDPMVRDKEISSEPELGIWADLWNFFEEWKVKRLITLTASKSGGVGPGAKVALEIQILARCLDGALERLLWLSIWWHRIVPRDYPKEVLMRHSMMIFPSKDVQEADDAEGV